MIFQPAVRVKVALIVTEFASVTTMEPVMELLVLAYVQMDLSVHHVGSGVQRTVLARTALVCANVRMVHDATNDLESANVSLVTLGNTARKVSRLLICK